MLHIIRVRRHIGHAPFMKFYLSIFEKLFICIRMPNFKSVALLVLMICLRVCQILWGSRDTRHSPFRNFYLSILEKLSTCTLHAYAKFEVCSFSRFGDMFEGMPNFIRVAWPRRRYFSEFLFVHFGEFIHVHAFTKFEVCSFSRFGDMFEGVANFIGVTWPRPRPFSEFLFVHFGEIVHMHAYAKFEVCSITRFGDMFEGVPNFVRVTWPRPRPS